METILPKLVSFPPHPPPPDPLSEAEYDKQIKALVHTLNNLSGSKLTGGVKGGGDLLEMLDPSINTLPYLYVLLAHIKTSGGKQQDDSVSKDFATGGTLWLRMTDFMKRFDPVQIRYSGNEIRRLIDLTAISADRSGQPALAIAPIQTAILRIDPSGATLTSSHVTLATVCLTTRAFASALPILDHDILFFPPTSEKQAIAVSNILSPYLCSNHESSSNFVNLTSGISDRLTYHDHLQYFLYGGMIYMALKDWERALLFLETVIAAPGFSTRDGGGGASRIQVEAYKKWVLVGLIYQGHLPHMPKNVGSQASRAYQTIGKAYIALADIFKRGIKNEENDSRLLAEARFGHEHWETDFNEGLVKQVIHAYQSFSILHLEKAYAALTIAEVTRRTSPDANDYTNTANQLSRLIAMGQLKASISRPSEDIARWVVRFSELAKEHSPTDLEEVKIDALKSQTAKISRLMNDVQELDRQLGFSKEFIADAKAAKKMKDSGQDTGDSVMPNSTVHQDLFNQDEDMMAET